MPVESLDSSMLCWWPALVALALQGELMGISLPQTSIFMPKPGNLNFIKYWACEPTEKTDEIRDFEQEFMEFVDKLSWLDYPCFLRTDKFSGKHEFIENCFVPNRSALLPHLYHLLEYGELVNFLGFYHRAIVIREFIELDQRFTAFKGMPVAPEFRAAVMPNSVKLYEYWPEEAIEGGIQDYLCKDWKEKRDAMYAEIPDDEKQILREGAIIVQRKLSGEWSVDFAKAKNGNWYLIDMALLHESWIPKEA